ncbi:MAG: PAS domain S-box protein [Candidatus Viridilinea halotolerans]|uniref:PAS domain S-box protein n=1 Tax=Candidatus Viridilinea halotolerans TaxID=2491704 RepID=A0A426TSG1_9CHLR|nr:MAG: PAS domain S-box protein [Candidatus Viridilinea halotolerans]
MNGHSSTADQSDLLRSSAYLQAIVQAAAQPIYAMNPQGLVLTWNAAAERVFGWSGAEVIGRPLPFIGPDEQAEHERLLAQALREELPSVVEVHRQRRDGTPVELSFSTSLVRDAAGQPQVIVVVATDITAQRAATEALRVSEARFRLLAEHAQDIIYRFRLYPDTAFEYVSPSVTAITGYTPEDHYTDPNMGMRLIHPDDLPLMQQLLSDSVKPHDQPTVLRWVHRDGHPIWTEHRNVCFCDETGRVVAVEGIARDITERIEAATMLDRYRLLSEHARDIVLFIDPESGTILEANHAAIEAYGYSREQLIGAPVIELRSPETRDRFPAQMARAMAEGILFETEHCRVDGTTFPVEVSSTRATINGKTTMLSIVRDISARRRGEAERDLLRSALAAAANAVVITNAQGHVQWANPAFTTLTGYSVAEVLGHKTSVLRSGRHDPSFYSDIWQKILSGHVWHGELINRRKDGSLYTEEMTITPVRTNGQIAHFVAIKQEVTSRVERRREHEALLSIAATLRQTRSRAELMPTLLQQTCILLDVESAALGMRDPATGDTVFELGFGRWDVLRGIRLSPGVSVSGRVMLTGNLYHSDDIEQDDSFVQPDLKNGVRAAVCAPLSVDDAIIGVLWVGRQAPLSPAEARLVAAIADLAASAIHRATLTEQTERRLRRLMALRTIDHVITGSFDVRLSLNAVLEQVVQQLEVDAAAVLLLNAHSLTLEHAASRGFRTNAILSSHVRLGSGLAGKAALERRLLIEQHVSRADSGFLRGALIMAEGFESYIAIPLLAKGQVRGILEVFHRAPLAIEVEWLDFLETLASQAAVAVDNAELFERMERANSEMALAYDTTLEGWSRALELRDKETDGHSQRVTSLTIALARAMGISEAEIVHVRRGALLHDIGKMGIPDAILLKPGPLTAEEREVIKLHPGYAYELLRPIPYLRPALDIPYCHHEKWDGSGYPRGLKGEEIPIAARIFAVVDVFDAVTSDRPYQRAWPIERAINMIREEAGRHFDPEVVAAFLWLIADQARDE